MIYGTVMTPIVLLQSGTMDIDHVRFIRQYYQAWMAPNIKRKMEALKNKTTYSLRSRH